MERKNKACWNGGNYKAYYTKELCRFMKQKEGYCTKHGKNVCHKEQCELWRTNYRYLGLRKKVAMRALSDILTQIVEIRQILFESMEADKSDPVE